MISKNTSSTKIIGENILTTGRISSAFYVMPGFSYSLKKIEDIDAHIDKIYQMFTVLIKKSPNLSFCLYKLDVPFTKEEISTNLKRIISKWSDKGIRFEERIKGGTYSVILLEIFLEDERNESTSVNNLLKEQMSTLFSGFGGISTNYERLFEIENEYMKMLSVFDVYRASRDLVFRYLLKQIFPGYSFNIDIKNLEYNTLLGNIDQYFNFRMGYFMTQNDYVSSFGLKPRDVYSCIINFDDFPVIDDSYSFILPNDNTKIFVKTSDQGKLELALKHKRSDLDYNLDKAIKANTKDNDKEIDKLDLVSAAIQRIKDGEIGCEARIVMTLSADSKKELDEKKTEFISAMLGNKEITTYSFLDQEKAFKEYYINRRPTEYNLMCDLRYMLSAKIDNFVSVGDFDSKENIGLTRIGSAI